MIRARLETALYRVPNWLSQDTEESIVGTEWHQEAAGAVADVLRAAAERRHLSWGVCEEIALHGLHYEDGGHYDPRPDVMVLAQPLPSGGLATVSMAEVGAPLLIIEVASRSTAARDRGEKRQAYAAIGVAEYLVFDADGGLLPAALMAWRRANGGYVPWRPEPDGWWQSEALGVSFHPQLRHLEVQDQAGERIELSHEVRMRARHLEQRLEEEARRRTELEREIRCLRARVEPNAERP